MAVNLTKGGNISLTKEAGGTLTAVTVGLGWDLRATSGADFDLDASAVVVGTNGKAVSDKHFVFFNNKSTPDGTVVHGGDNLTGAGEGDDETIKVNLAGFAADVDKVVFFADVYDAENRQQNFGQVRNAYIRIIDTSTDVELARFDLTEDASTDRAMIFGELYRNGADWKFRAVGQGHSSGLAGLTQEYGV
ncbi:MAG TPA: TerD family protein [Candidatus Saccharimonadales bacterium]|jgi:tellurium resistance protein TerD|nr:TerD family protein [Candidatus Saccharimonadales bacterium]